MRVRSFKGFAHQADEAEQTYPTEWNRSLSQGKERAQDLLISVAYLAGPTPQLPSTLSFRCCLVWNIQLCSGLSLGSGALVGILNYSLWQHLARTQERE